MSGQEDDYIKSLRKDFFEEAFDMLERMEERIIDLEQDKSDKDSLNEIFRAVHTLKGSAGAVELSEIASYAHYFEDLLDSVREEKIEADNEVIDVFLEGIDILKELINVSYNEEEITRDIKADTKRISDFKELKMNGGEAGASEGSAVGESEESADESNTDIEKHPIKLDGAARNELEEAVDAGLKPYLVYVEFNKESPMRTVGGVQAYVGLKGIGEMITSNPDLEELETDNFYRFVTYLVATGEEKSEVENSVDLDELTVNSAIEEFDMASLNLTEDQKETKEEAAQQSKAAEEAPKPAAKEEKKKEAEPKVAAKAEETKKEEKGKEEDEKEETEASAKAKKEVRRQSSFLRVESEKIDDMLNQVGELVTNKGAYPQYDEGFAEFLETLSNQMSDIKAYTRSNMLELLKRAGDNIPKKEAKEIKGTINEGLNSHFKSVNKAIVSLREMIDKYRSSYQMLTRTTNELQETVMNIRMVPISQIFNRFPRLVRDLSKELNKKIELEVTGEETELDKTVIEVLVDPLVHIIRNSIDHGIETEAERKDAGKNPSGKIHLSASHEGNLIIIKIIDDGKGINVDKVLAKAISSGLFPEDSKPSRKEILDTIFMPGLSTADKITNVSGRGVGMDVVKKSIEKINGSITLDSELGEGTVVSLRIPLTLAIIQALIVKAEGELYSIPLNSIMETLRVQGDDIISLEGVNVIKIRDEVISVIFLKDIFRLPQQENPSKAMYAVVITFEDKKVALIVDGLVGEQDIVIKPLKDKISNTEGVAGANILPDGSISFILDVQTIVDLGARRILESRALDDKRKKVSVVQAELERASSITRVGKEGEEGAVNSEENVKYAIEASRAAANQGGKGGTKTGLSPEMQKEWERLSNTRPKNNN